MYVFFLYLCCVCAWMCVIAYVHVFDIVCEYVWNCVCVYARVKKTLLYEDYKNYWTLKS